MKQFYVDAEECTGCQACVDELPEVFKMNDDDVAEIISKDASEDEIQDTMDGCPAECIHWK